MHQADGGTLSANVVKTPPFKSRYKLPGMMAAVVLMWIDFAYIYGGLMAGDTATVSAGMGLMVGAAALAYYFG